jgi:hypothetical protein
MFDLPQRSLYRTSAESQTGVCHKGLLYSTQEYQEVELCVWQVLLQDFLAVRMINQYSEGTLTTESLETVVFSSL